MQGAVCYVVPLILGVSHTNLGFYIIFTLQVSSCRHAASAPQMQNAELTHSESSVYFFFLSIHCSNAQTHGSGGRTTQGISCCGWDAAVGLGFISQTSAVWEVPASPRHRREPDLDHPLSITQGQHKAGLGETPRARRRFLHHGWIFPGEV